MPSNAMTLLTNDAVAEDMVLGNGIMGPTSDSGSD
jgi:hypothetical protein